MEKTSLPSKEGVPSFGKGFALVHRSLTGFSAGVQGDQDVTSPQQIPTPCNLDQLQAPKWRHYS